MQLTAKLIQLLPIQTGTGKNGEWRKQDIIVQYQESIDSNTALGNVFIGYPKKICVSIWGDKIKEGQLQIGNLLKIDFDIESREYNSKWYTDIKARKIEIASTSTQNTTDNTVNTDDFFPNGEDDTLPF